MFAIDDPSAVAVMPTPEAAGTPGFWTEGNPGGGQPATRVRASFMNSLQQELLNILGAAAIMPNKTAYDQLLTAILKIAGGSSRVRGLVGANNTGTPNTQFDFTCASVDMRNPTTGAVYSVTSPASKTCNILTAGPAVNGRDQAGAFSASSWVHFYYIFNPTTGAADTIASASATAPAGLPSGYSAWAYIGADYLTAGAILSAGYMRGSWFTYRTSGGGVNAGSAVVSTAVNLSAAVPPNALELKINVANIGISAAAGGIYGLTLVLELVAGSLAYQAGLQGIAPAAGNAMFISGGFVVLPNIGQNVNYYLTITAGAGPTTTWGITGFKMPNGGE